MLEIISTRKNFDNLCGVAQRQDTFAGCSNCCLARPQLMKALEA
jgi:hypothetical protein